MPTRLKELDGIRGIAILLVLVWHYFNLQLTSFSPGSTLAYLQKATSMFWSGVDLFFVLSGFLIGGIVIDHRKSETLLKTFYLRRVCRILPAYILLLVAFLVIPYLISDHSSAGFRWLYRNSMPLWSYLTFTQNFFMGHLGNFGANFMSVTWSLCIEEQFYLLLPLLILAISPNRLGIAVAALIVAAPLLRFAFPGFHGFVNTPFRMDSLLVGVICALLVRNKGFVGFHQRHSWLIYALFVFFLFGAAAMTMTWNTIFGRFDHTWLAFLYGTLLLISVFDSGKTVTAVLRIRLLSFIGAISYGLYLYHQPISGLLHEILRSSTPSIVSTEGVSVTLLALLVTITVATLSYRLVEQPILNFGRKYKYR